MEKNIKKEKVEKVSKKEKTNKNKIMVHKEKSTKDNKLKYKENTTKNKTTTQKENKGTKEKSVKKDKNIISKLDNKVKVSVIVPVYKTLEYLPKCLTSLVNQTLKEIEIIVVNDGSPDDSERLIKEYAKKYSNIKYYKKDNGGLSSARNYGIKYATGEYIGFVDSDDYVSFDMYEKLYKKAISTKSDIVVSNICYKYLKKAEKKSFSHIEYFGKSISEEPRILIEAKSYAWNKIYKKELWNNFTFPDQYYEDSAVIYNVMNEANKIECVDLPLYNYIKERPGSITGEVSDKIFDIFKSCDNILNYYRQTPNYEKIKEVIEEVCIRHIRIRLLYIYEAKNRKLTWKFFNEARSYLNKNIPNWKKNYSMKYNFKEERFYNLKIMILKSRFFFKLLSLLPLDFLKKCVKLCLKPIRLIKRYFKNRSNKALDEKRRYIQENGYDVLSETLGLLNSIPNAKAFADFGTMLGIVRENALLKHDLDMDIGVLGEKGLYEYVTMILERNGYKLWREYIFDDRIVEQSYRYKNIKVDINYYEYRGKGVNTWLFYRDPSKKYKNNKRDIVRMDYSLIDKLKKVNVKGKEITIPENATQILEEKYGKTWQVPDKGWIYWQSPAATKIPGEGYFIEYKYK